MLYIILTVRVVQTVLDILECFSIFCYILRIFQGECMTLLD